MLLMMMLMMMMMMMMAVMVMVMMMKVVMRGGLMKGGRNVCGVEQRQTTPLFYRRGAERGGWRGVEERAIGIQVALFMGPPPECLPLCFC